jgi:hypothetical protein
MNKELEILDVEIAKAKDKINEIMTGMSLLGVFFLGIIPLFYAIMGIYSFTFINIRVALLTCVAIMLFATILSVMQWEINTSKLKKLYEQKTAMISSQEEMPVHKGKK